MIPRLRIVEEARNTRPGLSADDGRSFLAWLEEIEVPVADATLTHAGDLLLAFQCARGVPMALDAFEREIIARLRASSRAETDELRQDVRTGLLVARDGRAARISLYRGRSALLAWVRVVARRMRTRGRATSIDDVDEPAAPGLDPEGHLAAHEDDRSFRAVLERAAARLVPLERSLLVAHFLDGRTLDELARDHGIGRATVTRRLRHASDSLRKTLRDEGETRDVREVPAAESLARLFSVPPAERDPDEPC